MPSISTLYLNSPDEFPYHFSTAWNEKDADALASVFAPDADFVNVTGLWWHNKEDIWQAHDYGLRTIFPNSTLEVRKARVKKIGDLAAVVQARFKLKGQSSHDTVEFPGDRKTIFTFVVKKYKEGWQCISAHNTDIVPGKETHIKNEEGKLISVDYRKEADR